MGKILLPETVKVARQGGPVDTSLAGEPFPITLGPNEVIVLLSLYYWWYGTLAAGNNVIEIGLWRKTDSDPTAVRSEHTDMIWNIIENLTFTTESLRNSNREHVIFPWPVVLIRAPRLITMRTIFTAAHVTMRLYYVIQEIADEELAQLMVKDHA